ncbi:MAG: TlyA family RNA methyltransferase [Puniceicoccales bacterium]|jgi:23S rRNA (cytidine1920-2'-O)/16S rRNA (cytidine1409-2'-O)-methyltransferase|nr:TlyA family RNA methyltransferase [Puniceicoccales bacterium]
MVKEKFLRVDELLVKNGLATSRTTAQVLIIAGKVRASADDVVDKPSRKFPLDQNFLIDSPPRFVSRAGEKLAHFIETFHIEVRDRLCLDVGASTGGFSDCLLQNGAKTVVGIDVGHGQLHYKLQKNPRMINLEKVNARTVSSNMLPFNKFDIIVLDLSFISLKLVLENIWKFLIHNGILVALVKPQFEAGKSEANKHAGVIKDRLLQEKIVNAMVKFSLDTLENSIFFGRLDSPILGTDGNREFLLGMKKLIPNERNNL